jgi:3-oxoacyl-[acyl-carrier protein] reductase
MAEKEASVAGRVVIVTGASRGIGREIALALVRARARVVIVARTDSVHLQETTAAARKLAVSADQVLSLTADIRQLDDCTRVVTDAVRAFGQLDVLFNNAGLHISPRVQGGAVEYPEFWEQDPDDWQAICDTNIRGTYAMTRAAVREMIPRGFGKIVNVSTNRHTMVRAGGSAYGASKAFIEVASRVWAGELQRRGITINVLLPGGPIDTGFHADASLKARCLPIEIMRAPALWLASELSDGHSGQRFVARLWNEELPIDRRVAAAREDGIDHPMIM